MNSTHLAFFSTFFSVHKTFYCLVQMTLAAGAGWTMRRSSTRRGSARASPPAMDPVYRWSAGGIPSGSSGNGMMNHVSDFFHSFANIRKTKLYAWSWQFQSGTFRISCEFLRHFIAHYKIWACLCRSCPRNSDPLYIATYCIKWVNGVVEI